jgi:hypothetical protein
VTTLTHSFSLSGLWTLGLCHISILAKGIKKENSTLFFLKAKPERHTDHFCSNPIGQNKSKKIRNYS